MQTPFLCKSHLKILNAMNMPECCEYAQGFAEYVIGKPTQVLIGFYTKERDITVRNNMSDIKIKKKNPKLGYILPVNFSERRKMPSP